jgi:bifunctional DNA-binding transcriptional regulator/antitoxin component of YhaV-PrlF toxin-antitoxin module
MTNDIEILIDEYNKEISETLPIPEHVHSKDSELIRVLTISSSKMASLKTEIANILDVNVGDEILYILDKNGMVNVRKSKDKLMPGPNEKFISVGKISATKIAATKFYEGKAALVLTIPRDIHRILKVEDKERLAWILDDKNNIIIKDTMLSDNCTIKGEILDISATSYNSVSIPEIVRDLLLTEAGDVIVFTTDDNNIIVKSLSDTENLKSIAMSTISRSFRATFNKTLKSFTNPKDDHLLWILDNNGEIVLRNTFLPKTCI